MNPHNPMYGIYQYGARGALLNLIGSEVSVSGGNSMAPPTMVIASAQPTKIADGADTQGLVSTGQLSTLLPNPSDVTNVMESMKRISDAKYTQVTAYATNPTLNTAALGSAGIEACSYVKSAYVVDKYNSPSAVDPDLDPNVVGSSGIFTTAEYQASSDFQKTAAVMKLVIDGNAAAGTIEMDGFDYHTGDRATGETRDFQLGECIGAVLEYASRVGKPVMIYVFSDGSLASDGSDRQFGRRARQRRLDGRQRQRRGELFPGLQPGGAAGAGTEESGNEPAARELQSRRLGQHHQQSRRQQRLQSVTDGDLELHGAA